MIKELEKHFNIKIKATSAKRIREALASWENSNNLDTFNIIKLEQLSNGKYVDYPMSNLWLLFDSNIAKEKLHLKGEPNEIIKSFWEQVAADKEEKNKEIKTAELAAIPSEKNQNYMTKGARYEDIYLFTDTTLIKPNAADDDFFARFRITDENVLYKDLNDKVHILFKNERGKLDLQNELDNGDSSVWTHIVNDMGIKWKKYVDLYKMYLNLESTSTYRYFEKPMIEGIPAEDIIGQSDELHGEIFYVPTVFRYLLRPVIQTTKALESEAQFEKILCRGNNPNNTLSFNDMMDQLTSNWSSWTKGYIKKIDDWKSFSNRKDSWAVNVYDIPEKWKKAEMPPSWDEFFNANGGKNKPRILQRIYYYVGSCLDSTNISQQALVIADEGNTGKSKFIKLLKKILPKDLCGTLENEAMNNPRFAVYAYGLYKHHILVDQEYDGHSANHEFFKKLIGGDSFNCEIKGGKSFSWNAEGSKVILISNSTCTTDEHAIRRRIIPISFKQNFEQGVGMSPEFEQKLIDEGPDFLAYCYKVYKTCTLRGNDGYLVLNETQEKEYLETGKLPIDSYSKYLMKAFSEDEDLNGYFKCGDFTAETHLNDDFVDLYNELFEYSANESDYITVNDMKAEITDFIYKTTNQNYVKYVDCFNWICLDEEYDEGAKELIGKKYHRRYELGRMNSDKNSRFVKFLERSQGHDFNKVKKLKGKSTRIVTNIKFKHDPHTKNEEWK